MSSVVITTLRTYVVRRQLWQIVVVAQITIVVRRWRTTTISHLEQTLMLFEEDSQKLELEANKRAGREQMEEDG